MRRYADRTAGAGSPLPGGAAVLPGVAAVLLGAAAALPGVAALAAPAPLAAQSSSTGPADTATAEATGTVAAVGTASETGWSFGVGERAVYDVSVALGSVRASRPLGEARLTVEERETLDGTPVYRTSLEVEGGIPLVYRMDDRQVSWIATDPIRSLRYEERLRQGSYERDRAYRLDQESGTYTRFDLSDGEWRRVEGTTDVPMPEAALDEVSFLYLVRTLPLEPGRTWRFERFFEEDGNPVEIEVLRREEVRVPAGRFETVVVQPTLRAEGLFGEDGRAEVYVTDDERRIIVKIESQMKAGRANFVLTDYRPGEKPARTASGLQE